ncbi:peroxiredoxin family protein [Pleionea sp. CnH1-48]|uniref:peroxiredoxin family protein n=1 Tax=Pleionea sp. CnH1-48 TaxID=2954494 RepID=UPI0020969990|nr:peroxiredoxin family protein [Pleionea sp. CnH1-48]MCO7225826.1 peroxiredoxin family protein [Pleionea sp. CnH1-48]
MKSLFISVYMMLLMLAPIHASYFIISDFSYVWIVVLAATLPMLIFFLSINMTPYFSTYNLNLTPLYVWEVATAILLLAVGYLTGHWLVGIYYGIGVTLIGSGLYIYWYSKLERGSNNILKVGARLPNFELKDIEGQSVSFRQAFEGITLIVFYRGNWCPICMAQIKRLAENAKEFREREVDVVLVSPQPPSYTFALAKKLKVPFYFLVDEENKVAQQLKISSKEGMPKGIELLGYDSETVYPTVILTDNDGQIFYVDLTDNYRERPEPVSFIDEIDRHYAIS